MTDIATVDDLLELAEEMGWEPEELAHWWKVGPDHGRRIFVLKAPSGRAPQVRLAGFSVNPVDGSAGWRRDWFRVALDQLLPPERPSSLELGGPLMEFMGYGRLHGMLWFLGIEESYGRRPLLPDWTEEVELGVRRTWPATMDLRAALASLGDPLAGHRRVPPAWRNAARIARALVEHQRDWMSFEAADAHVRDDLGSSIRETLLGALFPLPAVGRGHWPYADWWIDRDAYREDVWPSRRRMWLELIDRYKPHVLVCHGPDARMFARDLFPRVRGETAGTSVVAFDHGSTRVVMAPFLGSRCSEVVLRQILAAVGDEDLLVKLDTPWQP